MVFVVLCVLAVVGELPWSTISSSYERLSVESRVLDARERHRDCRCCRVVAASSYHTEKRVVLGLGVWIAWRCYLCAPDAEQWLLLLHAAAELCCLLCVLAWLGCVTIRNKMAKSLLLNNLIIRSTYISRWVLCLT